MTAMTVTIHTHELLMYKLSLQSGPMPGYMRKDVQEYSWRSITHR